jgi:hypothetical protein
MNENIKNMHTEELIRLSINVNAESQARLNGTMFALSAFEQKRFPASAEDTIRIVLEQLRGKRTE